MKDRYLTTEPSLDPPEEINYNARRAKRDSKQEMDLDINQHLVQQTFHLNQQSQDDEQKEAV